MNIQSLTSNVLVGTSASRPQSAPSEAAVVSTPIAETTTQQQPAATQKPSSEQVSSAVKAANEFMSTVNNALEFSVDKDTGTSIIKVVDKNTQEVIRQIPSEEMLVIAKALDTIKGLLVHQKA